MAVALDAIQENCITIDESVIKKLSPVGHEHINILGRYSFHLPEEIENGALRLLIKIEEKNYIKGFGMLLPFLFRYFTNPNFRCFFILLNRKIRFCKKIKNIFH